ncbi:hypothetical protein C9E89_004990 [Acinetobacter sichuanensis]|nr:hypothetical protein C9E89_004990 [Acinetobacter sichuanensis]
MSTATNALNDYKLIFESDYDDGPEEYPSIYVETRSLKKANGIVTATTLEKYSEDSYGYKIRLQINCKTKTAKFLHAVWAGSESGNDMTPDFIGDVIKITSEYNGPYSVYKHYCN